MAIKNHKRNPTDNSKAFVAEWTNITENDTAEAVPFSQYTDKSVQVTGSFGGGTLVLEGSNDNGNTWNVLSDAQGNPLNISTQKLEQVLEVSQYVRPRVTGATGASLSVFLLLKE